MLPVARKKRAVVVALAATVATLALAAVEPIASATASGSLRLGDGERLNSDRGADR